MQRLSPLFVLIFLAFHSNAQDYEYLHAGEEHFFINNSGYLRGIRIDSVKTQGSLSILYPFRSPRGYYFNNQMLDDNSGSWLGKSVSVFADGTTLLENFWGDTVIIKTGAVLNESWRIYDDATDTFYIATVAAIDTMSVLGITDSVKILELSANNSQGILPADPLHNGRIIISKNHGIIRCCDMFMFPLHEPGKVYQKGFDYFLDKSTNGSLGNIFFEITNFHNPAMTEIQDFEVGDLFEYRITNTSQWGNSTETITVAEVNSKQITTTEINYTISGWDYEYSGNQKPTTIPYTRQSKVSSQQYLFDIDKMPEETGQQDFFTYLPNDTSRCLNSPLYGYYSSFINNNTVNTFEPCGYSHTYKEKLGKVIGGQCIDPPSIGDSYTLLFSKKAGKNCGNYIVLNVPAVVRPNKIEIAPNPAHDNITITTPMPGNIQSIVISSITGQIMGTYYHINNNTSIDVSGFSTGLYILYIKEKNGLSTFKKINIRH